MGSPTGGNSQMLALPPAIYWVGLLAMLAGVAAGLVPAPVIRQREQRRAM